MQLVFRKVADIIREKELAEKNKNEPPIEFSDDHPVRKLISRFRKLSYTTTTSSATPDDDTEAIYHRGGGGGDQEAADVEVVGQAETGLLGGELPPSSVSFASSPRRQKHVATARKPSNVAQQQPPVVSKWNAALISLGENCRTFGRRSNNYWGEGGTEEEEGRSTAIGVVAERIAMRRRESVYPPYSENEAFENNEDPKEMERMNERASYSNLSFYKDIAAEEAKKKDERHDYDDQNLDFSSEVTDNGNSLNIHEKRPESRQNDENISDPKIKSKKFCKRIVDLSMRETKKENLKQLSVDVLRPRDESADKIYRIQENAGEEYKKDSRRKQTRYENDTNSDIAGYKGSGKTADPNLYLISSNLLDKHDDANLTLSKNLARQDPRTGLLPPKRENGLSVSHGSNFGTLVPAQRRMLKFLNNIKTNLHLEIEELHHRMDNIDQHLDLLTAILRPDKTAEAAGTAVQSAASSSTSPPADYYYYHRDWRSPGGECGVMAETSGCSYSVSTDVLSCASGVTSTTEIAVDDLANDDE